MEGGYIYVKTLSGETTFGIPISGKAYPRCLRLKEEICKNEHVKELIPNLMPSLFKLTRVADSDECIPHDAPIVFNSTVYIFMTNGRQKEIRWEKPKVTVGVNSCVLETVHHVEDLKLPLFVYVTYNNTTARFEIPKRGKKFDNFKRLVAKRLGISLDFVLVPQNGIFAKRVKLGDSFEIKLKK